MLSPQALFKGLVSRALPAFNTDSANVDVAVRQGSYGELVNQPLVRKAHNLADEGTYFVANNNQTASAMTTTAAFSATAPFVVVQNLNVAGGANVYVDYVNLVCLVQGTAASGLTYIGSTAVVDSGLRYSSGGLQITNIVSPNMSTSKPKSGAAVYYGAITASAASASARTVVGLRNIRPALSGTVANTVGDMAVFNFGGVEGGSAGNISITASVASIIPVPMPPVVIGPQQSFLLYVYYAAVTTPVASQFAAEIAWWER